MGPDARRLLDVLSAPGDDDATVHEARQLLGMTPGPFDEAFRYRWRGWLDAVGHGPTDFITGSQMVTLRRVRGRAADGPAE